MSMKKSTLPALGSVLVLLAAVLGIRSVLAHQQAPSASPPASLHPTFGLLDQDGEHVLSSGSPVSTMKTCGQCHDTAFIESHSFHSDLGLADYEENGSLHSSPGVFGKWNPLTYRFLTQAGDERLDLGTPTWLMLYGDRLVGGGPGTTSRSGQPLESITPRLDNPEITFLAENGSIQRWRWEAGTMEMNCFLCHLANPNLAARKEVIAAGAFAYASMAVLDGSGIVTRNAQDGALDWNVEAFDENGELKAGLITIQDPTNAHCAGCHREVQADPSQPVLFHTMDLEDSRTATTGQIISSQRISESGMNLSDKEALVRAWDVHAERQLQCVDCHYAPNNPARSASVQTRGPDHLLYDPRTLEIHEYLSRPDHNLARGQSEPHGTASRLQGTMRRCESCHDADRSHASWLPYIKKHMAAVACETCHIPQLYAPAIESYDWTVLTPGRQPVRTYRGVAGDPRAITSLVTGYQPVLLKRTHIDGQKPLAPYNLITSYYWVYRDAKGRQRPVRLLDLEAAYFEEGAYAETILSAFDSNGDRSLSDDELVIDTREKEETVRSRLMALGLADPRIEGLTQPYSISHSVARGQDAINNCTTCHSDRSRLSQPIKLSDRAPGNTLPVFDTATSLGISGEITKGSEGAVYYNPAPANEGLYIFGSSRVGWIDRLGALLFAGSVVGVAGHGTLRLILPGKQRRPGRRTRRMYMYEAYRRFWHWLQTTSIVILLFTGLIIHRPDLFGVFSFRGVVIVHNVVAVVLVVNALLSIFYHLATDRLREYLPRPHGFFDDAIVQAKYYISGIFRGEPHPFEKHPASRMNPIQKATYFGILHVLLPLQILTGALMWGVQELPLLANWFGGLPMLAPLHSLVAWTFAAFIVVHVYMTTTGTTPLEAMRAMVTGYEEVEVHGQGALEPEIRTAPHPADLTRPRDDGPGGTAVPADRAEGGSP